MDTYSHPGVAGLDAIHQLEDDLRDVAEHPAKFPRIARLLLAGSPQQAKKMVEEAAELAIEAVRNDREAAVLEAADLVYNLLVLLDGMNIPFDEVCLELARRRAIFGIAAKQPKGFAAATSAIPAKSPA